MTSPTRSRGHVDGVSAAVISSNAIAAPFAQRPEHPSHFVLPTVAGTRSAAASPSSSASSARRERHDILRLGCLGMGIPVPCGTCGKKGKSIRISIRTSLFQ